MANPVANQQETTLAPSELRYLVLAAQREGNRHLNRQLVDLDLTASQSEVILVLHEFGPLTLKELGQLIVCETGSPSRLVDALVRRGLVTRSTDEQDRRAIVLDLSRQGREFVPQLVALDQAINGAAIDQLSTHQLDGLVSALRSYLQTTVSGEVLDRRFGAKRRPVSEAAEAKAQDGIGHINVAKVSEATSSTSEPNLAALEANLSPQMLEAIAERVAQKIAAQF